MYYQLKDGDKVDQRVFKALEKLHTLLEKEDALSSMAHPGDPTYEKALEDLDDEITTLANSLADIDWPLMLHELLDYYNEGTPQKAAAKGERKMLKKTPPPKIKFRGAVYEKVKGAEKTDTATKRHGVKKARRKEIKDLAQGYILDAIENALSTPGLEPEVEEEINKQAQRIERLFFGRHARPDS